MSTEMDSQAQERADRDVSEIPPFDEASVSDLMHEGIITCEPDTPLRMVAATMASEHVHCVVVEPRDDGSDVSWSIISDLDLVTAVTEDRFDQRAADSAAISEFLTVAPGEKLDRAAQLMREHEVTHLVVVDPESRRPAGVLSTSDIAAALAWGGQ